MTTRAQINGTPIHYEATGEGPPLVLVHGSWGDAIDWGAVAGLLSESFRVIAYDRRGHSRSRPVPEDHTRRADEDDLAGVIESLAGGAAHVVTNSFGGLIGLGLAARRPELFASLAVHEPPVMSIVGEGAAELLGAATTLADQIEAGDVEVATRTFMEEIALGPGSWEGQLAERERRTFVANAPTFAGEVRDPAAYDVDIDALARSRVPSLITKGSEGPPPLRALSDELARVLPHAETGVFEGAGHAPHETHPSDYADLIAAFATQADQVAA